MSHFFIERYDGCRVTDKELELFAKCLPLIRSDLNRDLIHFRVYIELFFENRRTIIFEYISISEIPFCFCDHSIAHGSGCCRIKKKSDFSERWTDFESIEITDVHSIDEKNNISEARLYLDILRNSERSHIYISFFISAF
jgi:hypothetical protein